MIVGFDVGGTKCAVLLADTNGNDIQILERKEYPTKGTWKEVADTFCSSLDEMLRQRNLSACDIDSLGISCGGPLDSARGIVMSPPNLPGWDNVPITEYLNGKTGIKSYLLNDADACAVAEWMYGAGRDSKNFIFMTFGTGLGAGLILDGRLYTGTNNMAGEAGHMRLSDNGPVGYGKRGSFEGFCSGAGIAQQAQTYFTEKLQAGIKRPLCREAEDLPLLTAKKVSEAAANGDTDALNILAECGKYLGRGLAVLVDILNPEIIALGGVYMRARRFIEPAMQEILKAETLPRSYAAVKIVPATLVEQIGDYGAIVAGMYGVNGEKQA